MSQSVRFESTDGLTLVGEIDEPAEASKGIVLCHPHPELGGTMQAPLLLVLRDDLVGRGFAVLRFNFRGLGGSAGSGSTGEEEVADAEGALDWMAHRHPGAPLSISGWSFGGAVAVRAVVLRPELSTCAVIAPAILPKPGIAAGVPPLRELGVEVPLLVVCGSNDDVISADECRRWAEGAPNAVYKEIAGANHFFWGKYDELARVVGDWLDAS